MGNRKVRFNLSLYESDKEFIENKSQKFGFKSVSAFLLDCSKTYFRFDIDMSVYKNLTKEVNYVGHNINNLVRRVHSDGFYTDIDIEMVKNNQDKIYNLMNKEFKRLAEIRFSFTSDHLILKDTNQLVKMLENKGMEVPKTILLGEVFERIRNDYLYIITLMEKSKEQEEDIIDFAVERLYNLSLETMSNEEIIRLSNELFIFSERIKNKMMFKKYDFSDDDWYEFREILDEIEVN